MRYPEQNPSHLQKLSLAAENHRWDATQAELQRKRRNCISTFRQDKGEGFRCSGHGCCCRPQVEEPVGGPGLDEKVVAVYKGVGLIMKRFTTGKVPKAFKIIPNLQNWEEVTPSNFPASHHRQCK